MNERLFLLDGTLLFFRALYGVPDLFEDDAGRSINGVRGYLTYLANRLTDPEVCHCAVAFDESLTTCWRNAHYPAYKANRPPADEGVMHQLGLCRSLTEALNVTAFADLEYEADDFIATCVRLSRRPVTIVSRDKDLQQLLSPMVILEDPKDGRVTTAAAFRDGFGFEPASFPDYQALTGDSVDNIPGVPGVGPKSARRLVAAFGSLEGLYAEDADWTLAGVKPGSRMDGRLRECREQVFLYRRILRLDGEVPISDPPDRNRLASPSWADLRDRLDALGVRGGLGTGLLGTLERYCG